MLLRHYLERGVSKAALARRVGVSRKTIRSWIATGQLDRDRSSGSSRYSPRLQVPHKLAPYTGIIAAGLEEFPELSAQRLFDEVRAAGYAGSYGGVRDYIRTVRPCPAIEPVVRFETPAGRQGQVELAGEAGDRGLVEEGGHGPRPRPGEARRAPPRIRPYQQVAGLRYGADQPGMWTGVPVCFSGIGRCGRPGCARVSGPPHPRSADPCTVAGAPRRSRLPLPRYSWRAPRSFCRFSSLSGSVGLPCTTGGMPPNLAHRVAKHEPLEYSETK